MANNWKTWARPLRQQIVGRASRLALGYDLTRMGQRVRELETKIQLTAEPHRLWLYENRLERMDATVDIFDAQRRAFHLARYDCAGRFVADRIVGDIASGTGYGTEYLVYRGRAARAFGVDIDPRAVAYANSKHKPAHVEFICAQGEATGLQPQSLDVVVSFETIEHVPDDGALLAEFRRILKPRGLLVISTPNDWPDEAGPCHEHSYNLATFRAVLDQHFEIREMLNQNSGADHPLNHGQPAGIVPTTIGNAELAECLIAVCRARP